MPHIVRRLKLIFVVGLAIAICFATVSIYSRAARTMEYIVLRGSDRQRRDICMALPDMSPSRQTWALRRLLNDDVSDVRLSALTAYIRCPHDNQLDELIEKMLIDDRQPGEVRNRAGEILLARAPASPAVISYLESKWTDSNFRESCAPLVAAYLNHLLSDADSPRLTDILVQALDQDDPAHLFIQKTIRYNAVKFAAVRHEFINALSNRPDFGVKQFLLSCLAAIDGSMRGHDVHDWIDETFSEADDGSFQAVEAEWATEITPNYHIGEWEGVRCLVLGEDAGGWRGWLGGHQGSVDIGTATLSLYAPADGRYTVWVRCWFTDKCGNSFGFNMAGRTFANFNDYRNLFGRWHWLQLFSDRGERSVHLEKGFHRVQLMAWEDGVYIDKFALLPPGRNPSHLPDPPAVRWDSGLIPSISFALEKQGQIRGTRQTVVVWVRRNSPLTQRGEVQLKVGEPFRILSSNPTNIVFADGNPIARTSFAIELPEDAVAGEVYLDAEYKDSAKGESIIGRQIISAQFDWLSTGPLTPDDPLNIRLMNATSISDDDLKKHFSPLPYEGPQRYRNIDFEMAYGQLRHVYLYLSTEIEVTEAGRYMVLLNVDDTAMVYANGRLIAMQPTPGPGEGRLVMQPVYFDAGRHRLFVRVYQDDLPDPVSVQSRDSFNHCSMKLLIRKNRHLPAATIEGLPWSAEFRNPQATP